MTGAHMAVFSLLLVGVGATAHAQERPAIRAGDVVFQDSGSAQGRVIREVTGSAWSHVGLVLPHRGSLHVLEAISPVSWTPLATWLDRARGEVLVRRLPTSPSEDQVARMVEVGAAWVGRPYDARFEWGDARLYCSELVFLVFERALGLRLAEPQRWRELDLGARGRALARRRIGRLPPADGPLVTPEALASSPELISVP
ncbi:MAG: YiiX/YebB-like N1pC/P60 family cysteine hydrolase [Sandaracinaceae bacterium]